ncbi:MAG: PEGA domain-containing protein [Defluviitaleaceae bacterium]|nr:PEGA domain-containing protein [Defluviitaleaceae bacterium]
MDKNTPNTFGDDEHGFDDEYSLDNFKYDEKYDEKYDDETFDNDPYGGDTYKETYDYDDDYDFNDEQPLTDETPLTSPLDTAFDREKAGAFESPSKKEEPRNRPASRRETIARVAEDVQGGSHRKPGVAAPDTRLATKYPARPAPKNRPVRSAKPFPDMPPPPAQRSNKALFSGFYIAFLMLAIGLVLVLLMFAIGRGGDALQNMPLFACTEPGMPGQDTQSTIVPADPVELRSQTAMITGINPFGDVRTLTLLDVTTHRTQDLNMPDSAIISARHGGAMAFSELRTGHIVDVSFDSRTLNIAALNESRHAWTRPGRTNVQVDISNFTVSLGNESWSFNSQTLVLYRGEPFAISQVRPINSVTLHGQGDIVWLIQVDAAHGFLQFTNSDMIVNGQVLVGSMPMRLDDITDSIELAEGSHRLMIEGDNIETYVGEIVINQGETTRFNMGDLPLRSAIVHISVTPPDATVLVNGEIHEAGTAAQVEFGENLIRVEREGFLPQEQRLNIVTAINQIAFDLTEIVHTSTLTIFTTPTNAEIFINNVFAGHSTLTYPGVAPGNVTVIARLPGHNEARVDIVVTGNETSDIARSLILTPATNDPFDNRPLPDVDPIHTPAPFPTLPPPQQTPLPTLPPVDPFPPYESGPGDDPVVLPTPEPTPRPWWDIP